MKKRLLLIVVPLILLLFGSVVLAAYSADITVTEDGTAAHEMLACDVPANVEYMAANDFFALATGLDTRVQKGGIDQPHMLVDDRIMFAIPIPLDSVTNLQFVTDQIPLTYFYTIPGYGGYITVPDNANLEMFGSFRLEIKGLWNATGDTADSSAIFKSGAFDFFASPTVSGNVTFSIDGGASVTTLGVSTTIVQTIAVVSDGFDLEIYLDGVLQDTAVMTANVTDNGNDILFNTNNVLMYIEYIKLSASE